MANDSTFYNRDKMWFGTTEFMQWIDTPNTGADVSNLSFSADTVLLNGGGYVRNSWDSHKTYQFSWGESASLALVHALNAYRNGSWGRGLIYFHDPMTYGTNILPKRWADPSMAANYEAAPLIPDVFPTTTPAAPGAAGLPITSANYSLPTGYSSQTNNSEHFIPIPPGMTLLLGATYSGTGKLYIRVDGNAPLDLPNLDPAGGSAVNVKVTGQKAYLGIRNTSGAPTSISIQGITARLADTARVPDYMGTPVTNLLPNPSFETGGGNVDVVTNLLTNPSFETAGATAVVRTQRLLNPSFEVGTASWAPTLGSTTISRTTSQFHRGSSSLQCVCAGTAAGEGAYSTPGAGGAITTGTPFSGAAWVYAPAGAKMEIYITCTGTGGAPVVVRFDGTGTWQYVKAEGALPPSNLNPYMIIRTSTAVAAQALTFYVDEAIMEYTPTIGSYFDGGFSPVLRTNVIRDPAPTAATLWDAVGGSTRTYASGEITVVCPGSAANEGISTYSAAATSIDVASGGMWVNAPAGAALYIETRANSQSVGAARVNFTATGGWQYVTAPGATSAVSGGVHLVMVRTQAATPVTFKVKQAIVQIGSTVGSYFDGSSTQPGYAYSWTGAANGSASTEIDADLSTRWTGTADNSTSELTGTSPAGVTAADVSRGSIRSSRWTAQGAYSARVLAFGTNNDTFTEVSIPVTAGQVYTIVATARLEAPLTGTLNARARTIFTTGSLGVTQSASFPNAAGVYEVRHTVTASGTGGGLFRFYNGASAGGGDVWYDLVTIVAGAYSGPAFTGDTASIDPDLTNVWTGAANASTSAQRGVGVGSYSGTSTYVIQSATAALDGIKSARIIPTGATSDTSLRATISGLSVGETYTLIGYVTLFSPITASSPLSLGVWVGGATTPSISYITSATNAPGTYEVRATFVAGAASHEIRFYNGSSIATDNVYWDKVALIAGAYLGPWGSGTFTTPINIDEGQLPWYSGEGHSGVRFVGTPNLVNYNGVNGGQMGLSCNLKEVGAWA